MDDRRKRILFRSCHMGMNENDLLIGGFAKACLKDLDEGQLDRLEALLRENDNDIYLWITGARPVPPEQDNDIMRLIKKFNYSLGKIN
jgi:antitoxin CptB